MTIDAIEEVLNRKLERELGRYPNVKMFQGYTTMFMPVLRFYYRDNVIYQIDVSTYYPDQMRSLQEAIVSNYPYASPITKILIEKIEQLDKDLWYVFLAP